MQNQNFLTNTVRFLSIANVMMWIGIAFGWIAFVAGMSAGLSVGFGSALMFTEVGLMASYFEAGFNGRKALNLAMTMLSVTFLNFLIGAVWFGSGWMLWLVIPAICILVAAKFLITYLYFNNGL